MESRDRLDEMRLSSRNNTDTSRIMQPKQTFTEHPCIQNFELKGELLRLVIKLLQLIPFAWLGSKVLY